MRKNNKLQRTAVLALGVALCLAGVSYGQVMDKVPADALVVIKVANLAQTSAKVAKLAETLGVNGFVPQLNDPLGALKKQLKIEGGLKDDGELAFVYLDPKGGEEGKSMIILIPTTDYAALTGNIEGATKDGELTVVNKDGENTYIADWGGYAAASPMKELIATAPTGKVEVHPRAKSELDGNDLTLFANFAKLRGPLTADFAKNRDKAKTQMMDEMKSKGEVPEKYYPVAEAAFDQVFNVLDSFLRDADAATIGIKIGENGISQNVVTQFTEGSYLGKMTDDLHNDGGTLLTNLPVGKYLLYGGMAGFDKVGATLIDDLIGPVLKALPPDDEDLKMVPEYIASLKSLMGEVKGTSFGMVAPQGGIGQEAVFQYISTLKGDPKKITEQFKAMNDKYSAVMNKVMGEAQGSEMKQTYAEAAKEVDGVKFDLITTEFVGDTAMANQQRQMMQVIYGAPKVDMYIGSAGSSVVSFLGANDDSVKALVAAAKGNTNPLADVEPVKTVTKELPGKRVAEVYVQLDEIFGLAVRAANQFGFVNGNVTLAPDLQPLGISLSSEKSALEFKWYISNDTLQALVTGGLQASQLMNGGGGNGGGGL